LPQYRNTLRELLMLEDDFSDILPRRRRLKGWVSEQSRAARAVAVADGDLLRDR
jgi:hypothetical protein